MIMTKSLTAVNYLKMAIQKIEDAQDWDIATILKFLIQLNTLDALYKVTACEHDITLSEKKGSIH